MTTPPIERGSAYARAVYNLRRAEADFVKYLDTHPQLAPSKLAVGINQRLATIRAARAALEPAAEALRAADTAVTRFDAEVARIEARRDRALARARERYGVA